MRNTKALIMITVSAVMGITAVIIGAQWLGRQAALATMTVVVAARDIQLGTPLSGEMLKTTEWPSGSVPHGAINDIKKLEGRVIKAVILRGEAVLEGKLAPVGTRGGLSAIISEGKRAVTVRVNEVIGVAGFALPGNLVDVMINTKDDTDRPISKIVLEKILVLAVAQEASRDETKPKVVSAVTLELTPEQTEQLDLARSVGNLSLVLRNQLDNQAANTDGARKHDLLKIAAPAPVKPAVKVAPKMMRIVKQPAPTVVAAPAPDKPKLEVIKGVHKTSVEL
jgi:pilus assembly protein CpaB